MRKLWYKPFVYRSRITKTWRVEWHTCNKAGRDVKWHVDRVDNWQKAIERAIWLTEFYAVDSSPGVG